MNSEDPKQAARRLVKAALGGLSSQLPGGVLPLREYGIVEFREGTVGLERKKSPRIFSTSEEERSFLMTLPESHAFLESVRALPKIEQILPSHTQNPGELRPAEMELVMFFSDYLREANSLSFSEPTFNKVFDRWVSHWSLREVDWISKAPILGLSLEGPGFEVSDAVSVSSFPDEEKQGFWPAFEWLEREFTLYDLSSARWCVSGRFRVSRGGTIDSSVVESDAENVLYAMRLWKKGRVGMNAFRVSVLPPAIPGHISIRPIPELSVREVVSGNYTLLESEVPMVLAIHANLQQLGEDRGDLNLALRYFGLSYSRRRDEDRLLDLSIALESSVLHKIRDELTYRLAIRGATLIRGEFDPTLSFNILKSLYQMRSSVVHEGKNLRDSLPTQFEDLGVSGFLEQAEDIVRAILRTYVSRVTPSRGLEAVNKELELEILRAGETPIT